MVANQFVVLNTVNDNGDLSKNTKSSFVNYISNNPYHL